MEKKVGSLHCSYLIAYNPLGGNANSGIAVKTMCKTKYFLEQDGKKIEHIMRRKKPALYVCFRQST